MVRFPDALLLAALALGLGKAAAADAPSPAPGAPMPPGALARLGATHAQPWTAASCVALAPHGRTMAIGYLDRMVRLWDIPSRKLLAQLAGHGSGVHCVTFSADGKRLYSGGADELVIVWDVATGERLLQIAGPLGDAGGLRTMALSPDGRILAVAGGNGRVRLRDAVAGHDLRPLLGHRGMVHSVAFSPDGATLATASHDYSVRLWDVATGKQLQQFSETQFLPNAVVFSPNGKLIASAGEDRIVRLWDVATTRSVRTFHGHLGGIRTLVFSPDGRTLLSGSADRTIRLWELATGKERLQFHGMAGLVTGMALAPNGRFLASAGTADSSVWLWDLTGHGDAAPGTALNPWALAALWKDLAADDANQAFRAVWALAAAPQQAIPYLRDRLQLAAPGEADRITRLVAQLDSDRYHAREEATQALEKLGELVIPALQHVLLTSASIEARRRAEYILGRRGSLGLSTEGLRAVRAIEALEQMGGKEARQLLERLSREAPGTIPAEEAQAALTRLARRS